VTAPARLAPAAVASSDEETAGRPWKRGILWMLVLGPFFFASYGFANWVASQRSDVGAIVFAWERWIPFVPWTIVPYWSIDLYYVFSVLVCTTRRELDVHARRLLCAQVISVACFLALPLTFTFERPDAGGVLGAMFDVLMGFDKPFNQAPSLHIALLVILWVLGARHVGRWRRWSLSIWFTLIGLSVLTTYQHHFIDVPTGAWVGWLCVWLFPDDGPSLLSTVSWTRDPWRRVLALRYAAAAILTGTLAILIGGWALWWLWAAGSIGLVAVIYAFLDERAFQKRPDGGMSFAAWWLLGPYFAGAWLNSRWWTRHSPDAVRVAPGLLLGRIPTRGEQRAQGTRAIVDLTAELPFAAADVRYVNVPQLDLTVASKAQTERAVAAIDDALADGPVLVCCALGASRSATAVSAWLVASGRAASPAEAIAQVRRARPMVVLQDAHIAALERFARGRGASPA
jgi:protein-tyrosine phosphatase